MLKYVQEKLDMLGIPVCLAPMEYTSLGNEEKVMQRCIMWLKEKVDS